MLQAMSRTQMKLRRTYNSWQLKSTEEHAEHARYGRTRTLKLYVAPLYVGGGRYWGHLSTEEHAEHARYGRTRTLKLYVAPLYVGGGRQTKPSKPSRLVSLANAKCKILKILLHRRSRPLLLPTISEELTVDNSLRAAT
eukprot:scaffold20741_cov91-Skeletonema_dohrnii-CCMP3373.AAC.3